MTDQILSQEEIDSLLQAMDKGEIDLQSDKTEDIDVEPYDLTTRNIKLRDQFQAFEEIYDKFSSILSDLLTATLQKNIAIEYISTEMMTFEKFISAFSFPTDFTIFKMDPLVGMALFVMEPDLVFPLIDCMFGGDGKPFETVRKSFTTIEIRMMKRFAHEVFECLEKAWSFVYPLKLSFKDIETKPDFIHIAPPGDPVIVIMFSLKGNDFSGNMHLCIPYLMLEPIKEKLSTKYLRDKDNEGSCGATFKELLGEAEIMIRAELGRAVRCVDRILDLKIDDIITLNTGPQDPVIVTIEDIPKYIGTPVVYKGNRSVQITNRILSNGGIESHG